MPVTRLAVCHHVVVVQYALEVLPLVVDHHVGPQRLYPFNIRGALLTLGLIPAPCRTVWKAAKQILRITPSRLDGEIAGLMTGMSQRYGFESFSHCVSRIGRGLFVEIHILLPKSMNHWPVSELDSVRAEIAAAIGSEGPNRWLVIGFTRDKRWL